MKMTTIWTLRSMSLRERISRSKEAGWLWFAHRLPRRLAYWSYIDTGVRAIRPDEIVPEVRFAEILQRIGNGK